MNPCCTFALYSIQFVPIRTITLRLNFYALLSRLGHQPIVLCIGFYITRTSYHPIGSSISQNIVFETVPFCKSSVFSSTYFINTSFVGMPLYKSSVGSSIQ